MKDRLNAIIQASENKLLTERNKRIKPATDDKILLGWNALLLTAFCKASAALKNDEYKDRALTLFYFLNEKFSQEGQIVFHSYKNNIAKHPAYLDDYAYLIQSCISLQQLIPGHQFLLEAKRITNYVIEHFQNKETGFFYFTHKDQTDIIARKIEIYDAAVPSGNSIMAENLAYLAIVFGQQECWEIANKMLKNISELIFKYPASFGIWSSLILKQVAGVQEIVITGKNAGALLKDLLRIYLPAKVLHIAEEESDLPLLKNKIYDREAMVYLCKNHCCLPPVTDINQLKKLLEIQ